jgi:hypothetical protein
LRLVADFGERDRSGRNEESLIHDWAGLSRPAMNERRSTRRRALLRRVWIIGLARPEAAAAMAVTAKSVDRRPRESHVRRT